MQPILVIGIIIFCGFVFGELATRLGLPKVTGYIFAGVLLNPGLFGFIPRSPTEHTDIVTNVSLSFITFSVGGTLLWGRLRSLGKGIFYITIFEAEFALLAVVAGILLVGPFLPELASADYLTTVIPMSLLIGCLASPTDPSATLAVVHQYKAKGPVTSTIMGVAAFDDALGIINYSLALAVAVAFAMHQQISLSSSVFQPIIVISGAVACGVVFGLLLNLITWLIAKESEGVFIVVIMGLLSICFGVASWLGLDELLATMTMGVIVVNFNPKQHRIFAILERYTEELIFVLFFTLSSMQLDFSVLAHSYLLVLLFVVFRSLGKVFGTMLGAHLSRSPANIRKYTAGGLIPQGGIVIGLALLIKQNPAFASIADVVVSVVIGATLVHEFVGPLAAKLAIKKAGELHNG